MSDEFSKLMRLVRVTANATVDLARHAWGKVEQIRAKQAAKPKNSPLPAGSAEGDATFADGIEAAARFHDEKAAGHAQFALWCGPNLERFEGVPPAGMDLRPMNGPATAYLHEIGYAAAIRAMLAARPGSRR